MTFEELIVEAESEGLGDTESDNYLSEQALLYVDSLEEKLTENQRDTLIEAYIQGFKKGL